MAHTKPKNTQKSKLKSPAPVSGLKTSAAEHQLDQHKLEQFWQQELSALTAASFTSVEAAIDSVIERVLKRIDPGGGEQKLRTFLRTVLSTDPSICDQLRRSLRIG